MEGSTESVFCKDYLTYENNRNKMWHKLYSRVLEVAFGNVAVIGHHVCFNVGDNLNEIPSADCLIFDHYVMKKVFGDEFEKVITKLALTPVTARDEELYRLFESRGKYDRT